MNENTQNKTAEQDVVLEPQKAEPAHQVQAANNSLPVGDYHEANTDQADYAAMREREIDALNGQGVTTVSEVVDVVGSDAVRDVGQTDVVLDQPAVEAINEEQESGIEASRAEEIKESGAAVEIIEPNNDASDHIDLVTSEMLEQDHGQESSQPLEQVQHDGISFDEAEQEHLREPERDVEISEHSQSAEPTLTAEQEASAEAYYNELSSHTGPLTNEEKEWRAEYEARVYPEVDATRELTQSERDWVAAQESKDHPRVDADAAAAVSDHSKNHEPGQEQGKSSEAKQDYCRDEGCGR